MATVALLGISARKLHTGPKANVECQANMPGDSGHVVTFLLHVFSTV